MLRLLKVIPLFCLIMFADEKQKIKDFVHETIQSPVHNIESIEVVESNITTPISNWRAYNVKVKLNITNQNKKLYINDTFFTDGEYLVQDFINIKTRNGLKSKSNIEPIKE